MIWLNHPHFKTPINLVRLLLVIITYVLALYGYYLAIFSKTNCKTIVYHLVIAHLSVIGMFFNPISFKLDLVSSYHQGCTLGAHRYFCHGHFETNTITKLILLLFQTYSGQLSVYEWARDHRLHHKCRGGAGDPYDCNRGLFYTQIGYYFMKRTKQYEEEGIVFKYCIILSI